MTFEELRELTLAECRWLAKTGSADKIAAILRDYGIAGTHAADNCPLAHHLADVLMMMPGPIAVTSAGVYWTARCQNSRLWKLLVAFDGDLATLCKFVCAFDDGVYPHLEAQEA